ncbi:MAG: FAD-dependent oxidoreductase [Butyricicoccus sp.]
MHSIWYESTQLPEFPALDHDAHTDVLIIGGGMAGILTAYLLQQCGVDYMLVEKDRIAGGTTGHTTAKITVQHGLVYHTLRKRFGLEAAQRYFSANQAALQQYDTLCPSLDCDYERKPNYVYSMDNRRALEQELDTLEAIGCEASLRETLPLPFHTAGAVCVPHQAQFHPLRFLSRIADGLSIYEHTFVRELRSNTAITDRASIQADKIVVTTHFPFFNKHGSYFLKLYQHRSYVLGLENAPDVDGMYVDESRTGLSFRSYGRFLLLGGGGHRTGKPGGGWDELRAFAAKQYPDAVERYHWAAQDCMSLDGMPYIGRYSSRTSDLYTASGFNKWGMTGCMLSALLLRDQILGQSGEYADLFSPSRSILRPQLLVNGWEAAVHLLTPSRRRCPHLGCALKWNAAEHSWDCPCHGSRFAEDGHVIDNPANGDRTP